jgi:hypothetical protein
LTTISPYVIIGYYRLYYHELFVVIGLVAISANIFYWCPLLVNLLVAIGRYWLLFYWWLLVVILLMVTGNYFSGGY